MEGIPPGMQNQGADKIINEYKDSGASFSMMVPEFLHMPEMSPA